MKIKIQSGANSTEIMRRCSYGMIRNREGQVSFVRRLGGYDYPRFHAYLEGEYINLHLDQKKPSYQGAVAHSGEYDGDLVLEEAERIKQVMAKSKPEHGSNEKENKGFFSKLFGG